MPELLTALPAMRPAPTEADHAYWVEAKVRVGGLKIGIVKTVSPEAGLAYLSDSSTGQIFAAARNHVQPEAFDGLREGASVRFYANRSHAVSELVV